MYSSRIQAVLAPVEPSSRSLVHPNAYDGGDGTGLNRSGPLRALQTAVGQLRLWNREGAVVDSQQSFRDVEKLRKIGGDAAERGLQVLSLLPSCTNKVLAGLATHFPRSYDPAFHQRLCFEML